jgi:hypothetical protein
MAMPALKLELETPVEDKIARLETHVEHIQSDVTELKTDVRRLNDKVDSVEQKLTAKIDGLKDSFANFQVYVERAFTRLETTRAMDRVWWLLMSAALLGVMARAFKWI